MRHIVVATMLILAGCSPSKARDADVKGEAREKAAPSKCPVAGVAQPTGGNAFGITSPASFTDSCEQGQR